MPFWGYLYIALTRPKEEGATLVAGVYVTVNFGRRSGVVWSLEQKYGHGVGLFISTRLSIIPLLV